MFNLESMALATEELWFPEWEFGGPAWSTTARRDFVATGEAIATANFVEPLAMLCDIVVPAAR